MAQYIDKAAIVAEIKRRISLFKKEKKTEKWSAGASQMNVVSLGARIAMLEEIKVFLDTLEVKEEDSNDAFIEKACVKLEKLMYNNFMLQSRLHREEVIDHFIEDFKNYMKEK